MKKFKEFMTEVVEIEHHNYTTNYYTVHGTHHPNGRKNVTHEFLAKDEDHAKEQFMKHVTHTPRVTSVRKSSDYITHSLSTKKSDPGGIQNNHHFKLSHHDGQDHIEHTHEHEIKIPGGTELITHKAKMSIAAGQALYKMHSKTHPHSHKSAYDDPRDVATAERYGHKRGYTGD